MDCTEGPNYAHYENRCHRAAKYTVTVDDSSIVHYSCGRHLPAAIDQLHKTFKNSVLVEPITGFSH